MTDEPNTPKGDMRPRGPLDKVLMQFDAEKQEREGVDAPTADQTTDNPQPDAGREAEIRELRRRVRAGDYSRETVMRLTALDNGWDPQTAQPQQDNTQGGPLQSVAEFLQPASELWRSVGGGIAKAGFETMDFIAGEPTEDQKSQLRRDIEQRDAQLRAKGPQNAIASSMAQFTTGMIGAGKVMAPIKGVQKLKAAGKAGRFAYETIRGAAAGGIVIDPHEERLSNLIESFPSLQNPVTEYLAADPKDSAAEGRLKNALEGIGLDLAVAGTLAAGVRALKLLRGGDQAGAAKIISKLDQVDEGGGGNTEIAPIKSDAKAIPLRPKDQSGYDPKTLIDEAQTAEIIDSAKRDFAAIEKYGSREEAIAEGHKFSSYNIPWQKMNSTDELRVLVERTSGTIKTQLDARKGGAVLSDPQVSKAVRSAADMFGEDPDVLMGELVKAGDQANSMVANMEASYIIARKLFDDAYDAATKVQAGMYDDFGGAIETAQEEVRKRLMAASDMLASGSSMRAAAGRAVRRNRAEFAISPEDIQAFSKIPGDELIDKILMTKGEVKLLKQAAQPSFWRKVTDEATFLLTNNLLWNYPTHIVNTTTNLYMMAARPAEKIIGSAFQGSRGGAIRRQAMREYRYTLASLGDAWEGMVAAFTKGDSIMSPHTDEYFAQGSRVNTPQLSWRGTKDTYDNFYNGLMAANYKQMAGAAGDAATGAYRVGVGLPTRALGSVDEFIKVMRYRSVVQARAAGEAAEAGLTGADFKSYVARKVEDAFTPDGRAVDADALQEAKVVTFQQELLPGTVGSAVKNFRHQVPATALVLPYVKTPINVLRYAWKMTPGLDLLQTEYRQALKGKMGPEAQAHAIGQFALGSTFMAMAAALAAEGKLTGSGPADPVLRQQMMATGWKPNSIVFTAADGSREYFPIGRFDPVGLSFALMADLVDIHYLHPESKEAKKGSVAVGLAVARSFADRSFVQSVSRALRAVTDPERSLAKFGGSLGGALVPGSSALANYANTDPYLRDARQVLDIAMKGLPAYSETLPPKRDSFGEPIWRQRGLTTIQGLDVVGEEHVRIIMETGDGIRPPAPTRNGVDLRDVTLSDGRNAFDVFQERAAQGGGGKRTLRAALEKLITSNAYAKLVDGPATVKGTKLAAIGDIMRKFRETAFKSMLRDYPELRQEVMKRQTDVRDALRAKKASQGQPTAAELYQKLKDMGY